MKSLNNKKLISLNFVLIFILIITFIVALIVGRYPITLKSFYQIVFKNNSNFTVEKSIIINLRLPRTLVALFVGASLSLSGLVYQESFQNKLVSPSFLGVSSGSSVGAAFAIILGFSSMMLSLSAFVAGLSAMILTLMIGRIMKDKSPTILILAGIIVSSFMSATLSLLKYLADAETQLATITYWLMGSFEFSKMADVYILAPVVIVCAGFLFIIRWRINIVAQGPSLAQTQGLNYNLYRNLIVVAATLLTATSVAFAGVIGWVGLVIPHIIRLVVGRNTKNSIPLTITVGAIFMILTDILSRTFTGSEIPLSAITGFLGTPIFVYILLRRRRVVNV
jgi:iron complex transport system permease protein